MPYKRSGTKVLVKRGSRWVMLKKHSTVQQAQKHLAALRRNVKHG